MALALRFSEHKAGPAASLDPGCRLACLTFLSAASLVASWPLAAALAIAFLCLLRLGGLKIRQVLLESSFVLLFALATTAMHFWSHPGEGVEGGGILGYGGAYCIKLFAAFLSGRLFYASTRISEIRDSVTRILRRVPFVRRFDAGMALSLVLSYVPLIFEEWRYCLEAARARGMPRLPRPNQASAFLGSFLRRLMLKAVALPEALYARGWCLDRGLVPFRWRKRDSICLATAAILFAGAALHVV